MQEASGSHWLRTGPLLVDKALETICDSDRIYFREEDDGHVIMKNCIDIITSICLISEIESRFVR